MNNKEIHRGDVFYVSPLNPVGSEYKKSRPAVVVSNDRNNLNSPVVEICYFTLRNKSESPTHVYIKEGACYNSTVICEQITTISIERMGDFMCHLSDSDMEKIDSALLSSLGITPSSNDPCMVPTRRAPFSSSEAMRYEEEIENLKREVSHLTEELQTAKVYTSNLHASLEKAKSFLSSISTLATSAQEVMKF